jgi:hypothetical protein
MVNAKAGAAIAGSAGDRHHLAPIPRQEFSQVSDLMIGDPGLRPPARSRIEAIRELRQVATAGSVAVCGFLGLKILRE